MRLCAVCGTSIEAKRRHAVYCGGTCAKRAQRMGLSRPLVEREPLRDIIPTPVPLGRMRKPSVDDIAQLLMQSYGLAASFRYASERADFRLRAMCARLSRAISDALEREGVDG